MKCGIAGLVTTLDIKISGWSNLRVRSRTRITKKITKLRTWLLPFEHNRREEDSPMATLSAVAMSYHTEQLFGSHRYHTSKPTFREEMCEILIEQCFLPSHGLRCTKISNLSKFVGVLRKQNYAESNHIDLASFPVPQPAACNYVSKYMYLEGLFTLLCMDRMHRNCRVQKEPSKVFPNIDTCQSPKVQTISDGPRTINQDRHTTVCPGYVLCPASSTWPEMKKANRLFSRTPESL